MYKYLVTLIFLFFAISSQSQNDFASNTTITYTQCTGELSVKVPMDRNGDGSSCFGDDQTEWIKIWVKSPSGGDDILLSTIYWDDRANFFDNCDGRDYFFPSSGNSCRGYYQCGGVKAVTNSVSDMSFATIVFNDLSNDFFGKATTVRIEGKVIDDDTFDKTFSAETVVQEKTGKPTGLMVSDDECDYRVITWTNNKGTVTCPDSQMATDIERKGPNDAEFTYYKTIFFNEAPNNRINDTDGGFGEVYEYRVYAGFLAGSRVNLSDTTDPVSGKKKERPEEPKGIEADEGSCEDFILVKWNFLNKNSIEGYNIWRRDQNVGTYGKLNMDGLIDPSTTEYEDTTADRMTTYEYIVRTVNDCNASSIDSEIAIGYRERIPVQPTNFTAVTPTTTSIDLSWDDNSDEEVGYIIERTFQGSGDIFIIEVDADENSWSDTDASQCVSYTYTLKVKTSCEPDGVGDSKATAKLEPNIDDTFVQGEGFNASKGTFTDKVALDWINNNKGQTNTIIISRRVLESGNSFNQIEVLSGSFELYNDFTAEAGELYEYQIRAEAPCENDVTVSNTVTAIGFRRKTGIITGVVSFEGGIAVENVKITAGDATNATQPSVYMTADQYALIEDDDSQDLADEIIVETWFKPASYDQPFTLIEKPGSYSISYASDQYTFEVQLDGGAQEVQVDAALFPLGTWNSISGMIYQDTLAIFQNDTVVYEIEIPVNSIINNVDAELKIGQGFEGHIKEFRLWNKGKSDIRMAQDYSRFLAGNEEGLKIYLNAGENKGKFIYDLSYLGSDYNENHAMLSTADMWDEADSPESERLSIAAFTNEDGEYNLILPYSGAGQTFVLKPVFGIHKFEPGTRPVFIGDGASVQNNIDFIDVSTFMTEGRVLFHGTNCPSEGLLVKVDGEAVIRDGEAVFTDENGKFDIQVAIGRHFITLEKAGHVFSQGRFPTDTLVRFDFQETVPEIQFIDSTFRKVVGRVVGGDIEGNKKPALERSINNLGIAALTFDPTKNCGWTEDPYDLNIQPLLDTTIVTDTSTGEYTILLPPMEYIVARPELTNNTNNIDVIDDFNVPLDITNIPVATMVTDSFFFPDDSYRIDSAQYHKELNFIYQAPIQIDITELDGTPLIGDDTYEYSHPKFGDHIIDLSDMPYPVFGQNRVYNTRLSTFEYYYNYDIDAEGEESKVPVTTGKITITNDLAIQSGTILNLQDFENYDGDTTYTFIAGQPNITGDFTSPFQASISSGTRNDAWDIDGSVFRGYVVGVKDVEESDFVTLGPEMVDYVLRDPPGSQSFAERAVGISTTVESTWDWNVGGGTDNNLVVVAGTNFSLGIGYSTTTEIEAGITVAANFEASGGHGQTTIETITNEEVWATSAEPLLAGANSDLFIGKSRNFLFGVATKLEILPDAACLSDQVECLGDAIQGFKIGTQKSLAVAPEAIETDFSYTGSHIENNVIPGLEEQRANLIDNSIHYESRVDADHPCYGFNNDDIRWFDECPNDSGVSPGIDPLNSSPSDNDGPSYTFTDPLVHLPDTITIDSVRVWNQQIRLWKEALAQNEEEKALANKIVDRKTFNGGGSSFSSSSSTTNSFAKRRNIEFMFSQRLGLKVVGKLAGAGTEDDYGLSLNEGRSEQKGTTKDTTVTISYTLTDDSEWDKFFVEVYEGSQNGGPIFKSQGGRSSCPHEGRVFSKYYEPGTIIDPGTIQLEQPELSITPPILRNIPQSEPGIFVAEIANANQLGESWTYTLSLLNNTNEGGALIINSGTSELAVDYVMDAGEKLYQNVIVESGADYSHDSLLFVLHSTCQYQQGQSFEKDIADSAYFSIFFIPECTPIEIENPTDQWVVNNSFEDELNVKVGGYDYNYLNLDHIKFQYKQSSQGENGWITQETWYHPQNSGKDVNDPDLSFIDNSAIVSAYNWNLNSIPDGEYDFRAVSDCQVASTTSLTHRGYIDTQNPHAFGTPSPADGVLDPEDDIVIRFNENIDPAFITDLNIDVRGLLNGTTIRQQESTAFDGADDCGIIPEYQLQNRDLTIEFWLQRLSTGSEVVMSQGSSSDDQLIVGFNASNNLYLQLGDETTQSIGQVTDNDWHFYAVVYDSANVTFYIDNSPSGRDVNFQGSFNSDGEIYIGKNSATGIDFFQGNLQELRIWGIPRDQGSIGASSGVTLSGREPGLLGNWPLDDSWGAVAEDKVRSRHMALNGTTWNIEPASHSYKFDGTNDYLQVDDASSLSVGIEDDITIEGWFKTPAGGGVKTILSNGVPAFDQSSFWSFYIDNSGFLKIENNGSLMTTSGRYNDDEWYHFSFVLDRGFSIKLYINGQLVKTENSALFDSFGGAHLVLGAQLDGAGFNSSYSDFFEGHLDDIRIWNVARNTEQISRDFINQLIGDEPGLLAYYPFDFYEEDAGVLSLSPTLNDKGPSTLDIFNLTAVEGMFSNIRPSIKLPRKIKKIVPTFSVNGDEIFIDLNRDPSEIENVILDITVGNIRDFAGNYMSPAETWTAYIDKNQVFWETEYFSFEKDLEDNLSFTSNIKNTGGSQESYTIGNLPSWLTASPSSGLIDPNSTVEVTFTVQSLLNIGEYEQDIYVSTESFGFNERLLLDLKVAVDPPVWTVDPNDFDRSFNIVGQFEVNGVISTDAEDMVSAWVDDELRGVTHVEFDPSSGKNLVFLTVFSHSSITSEEIIEFRGWDASRGRLLKGLQPDDVVFIANGIIGSRGTPIPIKATVLTELTYELTPGWNWISFPLSHSDLSDVNDALKELSPSENDRLRSQDEGVAQSWAYSGAAWSGNTQRVNTNLGYKVFMAEADTFRYEGVFVDPSTEPIKVINGWNWVGVKSEFIIDVPSAVASLDPQTGDVIKGQRSFAIYEDGFGWGGNLDFLKPQEGYMLKYHKTDSLYYPGSFNINQLRSKPESARKSRTYKSGDVVRVEQRHNFVTGEYSSNMSLTAEIDACIALSNGDEELDLSQWTLAAFAGEECRGVVAANWVPQLGKYLYYLTIDGAASVPLTFKLIHNVNLREIPLSQSIDFKSNETTGTSLYPYQFTCEPIDDCIESILYRSTDVDMSQSEITRRVVSDLRSDARLPAPRKFIFKAGQSIELILGFEVENQATLEAYIEDCIKSN